MNSISKSIRIRGSLRTVSLCMAAGAVAAMGILAVAESTSPGDGKNMIVADTTKPSTPPPAPIVQSAAPTVKATTFAGGDWPGMGTFGEDWG
jgi:hypothetical protein